ncbi:hypothetical protein Krac_1528 [Ktedonobacter racemifer DSM 44963]|uniref:Uncharacterized protein n=1 Tax=Ktedonobacter racemifer DSM 44963 TaxID=485913 RepID=D6U211_KTERA|nr:hypothetical protein Krac_1528 [Ktedonobacter racemifer DSM 44963]
MGNIFVPTRPLTRDCCSKAIKRREFRRFKEVRVRSGELNVPESELQPTAYEHVAASIAAEIPDAKFAEILRENPEWWDILTDLHESDLATGVSVKALVLRHLFLQA